MHNGYHCSGLRKSVYIRTKVTRHTNSKDDEMKLFTRVHSSKRVATFVLRFAAAS